MEFTLAEFTVVGSIVLLSTLLQTMVGFGAAITGVPLLLLTGVPLQESVAIVLMISLIQAALGTYGLRRHLDWKATVRPTAIRLLALPVGNVLLIYLGGTSQELTKQVVGIVLLLLVLAQWLWRVKPADSVHVGWEWLAFLTSGVLLGFCGMGGPPVALWVMAHRWPAPRSRAFLFSMLFGGMIPQAIILLFWFGEPVAWALLMGLACLPWAAVGTYLGLWLSRYVHGRTWRRVAIAFLCVVAVSAILAPLR